MQLKIKKPIVAQGSSIPDYEPINLIGKTLFNQVKFFLGNKLVYDSSDMYAYRAFLETELNYGHDAKSSHLQATLYNKETIHAREGSGGFRPPPQNPKYHSHTIPR